MFIFFLLFMAAVEGEAAFVAVAADSDFPIHNLPYGVFSRKQSNAHAIGVAIGDLVLDLAVLSRHGLFSGPLLSQHPGVFEEVRVDHLAAFGVDL